jgi:chemotaxis protein CheC
MPVPVLKEVERDALTEACNIGMGHAATALSRLMGKPVQIEVPHLLILEPAVPPGILVAQEVASLHLQIQGKVRGSILILLRQENARRLLELLLGKLPAPGLPLSELEVSTLKEMGNILASACLNALGTMLKMTLLPSVPTLECGETGAVLARTLRHPPGGGAILIIDTMFSIADAPWSGSIFLIPAPASIGVMLSSLGAR